eukprot:2778026-Rhodomonas_salina.3
MHKVTASWHRRGIGVCVCVFCLEKLHEFIGFRTFYAELKKGAGARPGPFKFKVDIASELPERSEVELRPVDFSPEEEFLCEYPGYTRAGTRRALAGMPGMHIGGKSYDASSDGTVPA